MHKYLMEVMVNKPKRIVKISESTPALPKCYHKDNIINTERQAIKPMMWTLIGTQIQQSRMFDEN